MPPMGQPRRAPGTGHHPFSLLAMGWHWVSSLGAERLQSPPNPAQRSLIPRASAFPCESVCKLVRVCMCCVYMCVCVCVCVCVRARAQACAFEQTRLASPLFALALGCHSHSYATGTQLSYTAQHLHTQKKVDSPGRVCPQCDSDFRFIANSAIVSLAS
eukprot:1153749-Pelagomonas_calceolata.AAC.6